MILYNLKIGIRRLLKDKLFSGMSLFGLILGITSFLVLFLYINNEKSFDKHFTDAQDIYRIQSSPSDIDVQWARSLGFIKIAAQDIPEIKELTQFSHCAVGAIKIHDKSFQQNHIMSVDKAFFEMFSVECITGNPEEILEPNIAFVSEDFAQKYFPNSNPIGQIIDVEALQYVRDLGKYEIRGVVRNTQPKTHFNYHILLSQKGALQNRYETLPERKIQWVYQYAKLKPGALPTTVSQKLTEAFDSGKLKDTPGPTSYDFSLIPLTEIHLKSTFLFELSESYSKINISLFLLISFVILFLSIINTTNLLVTKLIKRTKEMGLKIAVGAGTSQIIGQIIMEMVILCTAAVVLSFAVIELIKPFISRFFEINFNIYYTDPIVYISVLIIFFVCIGFSLLFVLLFVVRNKSAIDFFSEKSNFYGNRVLQTLLVMQLAIIIILIASSLLVNKQIRFISHKSLGFQKENMVVLHLKDYSKDASIFANELQKQRCIKSVGFASQHLGYPTQNIPLEGLGIEGTAEMVFANYDYLKTMQINMLIDRIKPTADTVRGLVINRHLYNRLMDRHGSLEALDQYMASGEVEENRTRTDIIGVCDDFNYNSAHEEIGDFVFLLDESRNRARYTHIRLHPGDIHAAMDKILEVWQMYYPGQELNYFFLDEKIAQQYQSENMLRRVLVTFSLLAILISIIGISALSLFISQKRTKEIGIRKANGATTLQVMMLLNRYFGKWVVIAFVFAVPAAWFAMHTWLENFAYKTALSWWIFAIAGILALVVALITVSRQSWLAATKNPVEALRDE